MKRLLIIMAAMIVLGPFALAEAADEQKAVTSKQGGENPSASSLHHPVQLAPLPDEAGKAGQGTPGPGGHSHSAGPAGGGMATCPMMQGGHQGMAGMGHGRHQGPGKPNAGQALLTMELLNALKNTNALQIKMVSATGATQKTALLKELEQERTRIDRLISDFRGMVLPPFKMD